MGWLGGLRGDEGGGAVVANSQLRMLDAHASARRCYRAAGRAMLKCELLFVSASLPV